MQIREKGQKLLFIRTEYVPEKKRTIGKTVASQEKGLSTVSDEARLILTDEEIEQLEKWLSDRAQQNQDLHHDISLKYLGTSLRQARQALEQGYEFEPGRATKEQWADAVFEEISALKKAMRKAGYKQNRQTKEKLVDGKKSNPSQLHLEDTDQQ